MNDVTRHALLAAAVAALVYVNALGNGFAYDDVSIVVEDPALTDAAGFPERLAQPYWPGEAGRELGLWRPLTTAALAAQARVAGLEPAVFHGVNVGLHAFVTALVVALAGSFVTPLAALLAGLVFAVHPVHVEAVANVVGLSELLSAAFYLAACVLFLRWTGPAGGERPRPGHLAALGGLYAGAFLAKEVAVTLPAALLALDLVRRPVPVRETGRWLRRHARLLVVLGVAAMAVLAGRWVVLGSLADPSPPLGAHRLAEAPRVWTLGVVWLHYVRLLFAPFDLSADWAPGVIPVLTVWTVEAVLGVVLALVLLGAALLAWRRGRADVARLPALAAVWFLVTVAPVSNVLFLSGVLLAERTLYLPSVGLAVAAGGWLAWLASRRRGVAVATAALVLLSFTARTWTRTPVWHDTERVLLSVAGNHPASGRAQWMVGDLLAARGDLAGAKRRWARAIGLLDSSPNLLREIGGDVLDAGDERLGGFLLARAWEEDPTLTAVARRLAALRARQGRHDEAAVFARRVLEDYPGDAPFWHVLASSLEATGDLEGALAARTRVIELGEDPWQQWLSLARLRRATGDSIGASEAFEVALARAPGEPERAAIRAAFTPSTTGGAGVENSGEAGPGAG